MILIRYLLLLTAIALAASAHAQISRNADYFGKIGNTDFHVSTDDSGTTVSFKYFANGAEEGSGTIGANNRATFFTNRNRQVILTVDGSFVTGTLANQNFSAAKESDMGPLAAISGNYFGSFFEQSAGSSAVGLGFAMRLFPSGRANCLIFISQSGGVGTLYALGSVASNGTVTLSVSTSVASVNGDVLRFTFTPQNDIADGQIASNLFPRNVYTYILARAKASTVINVSTRGAITPAASLTAGFVVTGGTKTLLIRAIGPTLGAFGVVGANTDTRLTVFSGNSQLATNDNWNENANAADIIAASAQVGAFALGSGSRDAVVLVRLQPGAYTAQASSVGSASGDALIEVYEVTK